MGDIYITDFSGDPDDRAAREEERAARRAHVRARYADRLMSAAGIDEVAADLVLATLFDSNGRDGTACLCGCHPRLPDSDLHDAGFDCPCGWDEARREAKQRRWQKSLEELWSSPEHREIERQREAEMVELNGWIAATPGVDAELTTSECPEQWEGCIDGRSFYFRERHGEWRIELDLAPTGQFAQRFIGTDPDGEIVTEPVPVRAGTVIAEGVESALGAGLVNHLEFIVRTVRQHITGETCRHPGAVNFCPICGTRC